MAGLVKKGNPKKKSKKQKKYLDLHSKSRAERIHASRRLEERYDQVYTDELRLCLIHKIRKNETTIVKKHSNRVKQYHVVHEKYKYNVIYDKKRQEIVTFLPLEEKQQKEKYMKLKFENDKVSLDGDFKFEVIDGVRYNPNDNTPYKKIQFAYSPECPQDADVKGKKEEIIKLMTEKIKDDFKKFLEENL